MINEARWDLKPCCGYEEKLFLILYLVYWLFILLFWRWDFLKPLKLLGVFVHEMGHASAAWLTCGRVKGIEVYNNEAGIAGYSGGIKTIIIPAGYVGGAFWGAAFVALSGNRIGATIAAVLLSVALVVALAHGPNKTVVYISIGFSIITIVLIIIEWFVFHPLLEYFTLFYGVFLGYYACKDIWDDVVTRDSEGSDAQACHVLYPCCLPRCVGVQFLIVGIAFQIIGLYLGLVWLINS